MFVIVPIEGKNAMHSTPQNGAALGSAEAAAVNLGITRSSLRDQATDLLRAKIMAGELMPEKLYSINTLATSLGVSSTPVREALLRLSNEGLGHFIANRGFSVAKLSQQDLEQIVACRQMLEPAAIAQVAMTKIGNLAELYEQAKAITLAAREGDMTNFLRLDRDFHLELIALTKNDRLVSIVAALRAQTRLYGIHQAVGSEGLVRSAEEHAGLLDLIAAHDSAGASAAMSAHIGHTFGIWSGSNESPASAS